MKRISRKNLITAVASIVVSLVSLSPITASAMESRTSTNLKGIDVSHWDGAIDWTRVAASHVCFAYIKACGGYSFVDPRFSVNVKNARNNGIAVGAYDYVKPSAPYKPEQAIQQATFFVNTMKSAMSDYGDIMPVMDVEQTGSLSNSNLVRWIQTFANTVEHLTHRQVMLYTSVDFIQRHGNLDSQLYNLPLWVAYYDRLNGGRIPPNIAGWTRWIAWQYSDQGVVRGISGNVDVDAGPPSLSSIRGDLSFATTASDVQSQAASETRGTALSKVKVAPPEPKQKTVPAQAANWWAGKGIMIGAMVICALLLGFGLGVLWITRKRRKPHGLEL